jgi:transposase
MYNGYIVNVLELDMRLNKDKTIDVRSLSPQEQEFMREYIAMKFAFGDKSPKISSDLNVQLHYVERICRAIRLKGKESIAIKKMGRPIGSNEILKSNQEAEIQRMLLETTPDNHGYKGFLWDNALIRRLIRDKIGVEICRTTLDDYLKRWGFTAQRPVIYNRQQNEAAVEKWLNEDFPALKERAKEEGGEIFWGDETGVQNECNYVRGYAPKGETPVAKLSHNSKYRVNLVSAISNQGKLHFTLYEDNMTQQKLKIFCKRLIKTVKHKVFLVLDNLKVHHGKIFKKWVLDNRAQIEVFYLPSYSPERNPDEYFNGTLKREIEKHGDCKSKKEFFKNTRRAAYTIQNNTQKIVIFFKAKKIAYAS